MTAKIKHQRTKMQQDQMDRKDHFKLYKAGKLWLIAGMASLTFGAAELVTTQNAQADATSAATGQVATSETASQATSASNQVALSATAQSSASTSVVTSGSAETVTSDSVASSSAAVSAVALPETASTASTSAVVATTQAEVDQLKSDAVANAAKDENGNVTEPLSVAAMAPTTPTSTVSDLNDNYTSADGWTQGTATSSILGTTSDGAYTIKITPTLPNGAIDRPLFSVTITAASDASHYNTYTYSKGTALTSRYFYITGGNIDSLNLTGIGTASQSGETYYVQTSANGQTLVKVFMSGTGIQVSEEIQITASGKVKHTITYLNNGTTTLTDIRVGAYLDSELYNSGTKSTDDSVPVYADGNGGAYIQSADGKLVLYTTPGTGMTVGSGVFSSSGGNKSQNVYDMVMKSTVDSAGKAQGTVLETGNDTVILYKSVDTVTLAVGQAVSFSYSEQLTLGEDVSVPVSKTITIHHVDTDGNSIATDTTIDAVEGDEVTLDATNDENFEIDGYELTGSSTFTVESGTDEVILTYAASTAEATVSFQDASGNVVAGGGTVSAKPGTTPTTGTTFTIPAGYQLASTQPDSSRFTAVKDANGNVTGIQYTGQVASDTTDDVVIHLTKTVYGADNPGAGLTAADFTHQVTVTVDYGAPVGTSATQTPVTFYRTATLKDGVTAPTSAKDYDFGAWTTNSDGVSTSATDQSVTLDATTYVDGTKTPAGYTTSTPTVTVDGTATTQVTGANTAVVINQSYTASADTTLTVTYAIKDTDTVVKTATVTGTTGQAQDYIVSVPAGYQIDTVNSAGTTNGQTLSVTPVADDSDDLTIYVTKTVYNADNLGPGLSITDLQKTVSVTTQYGAPVTATTPQTGMTFYRTATIKAGVTEPTSAADYDFTVWTTQTDGISLDASDQSVTITPTTYVDSTKTPAGYTAATPQVMVDGAQTTSVTGSNAAVTVVQDYVASTDTTLDVAYVVKASGETVKTDQVVGATDQAQDYTVSVPAGYEIDTTYSAGVTDGQKLSVTPQVGTNDNRTIYIKKAVYTATNPGAGLTAADFTHAVSVQVNYGAPVSATSPVTNIAFSRTATLKDGVTTPTSAADYDFTAWTTTSGDTSVTIVPANYLDATQLHQVGYTTQTPVVMVDGQTTTTVTGANSAVQIQQNYLADISTPTVIGNHDGGYDITGKTTPNTGVTVTDSGGTPILDENGDPYTGTSDEDGNVTITIPETSVAPGNEVALTPAGGNTSTAVKVPNKPVVTDPAIIGNHDGGYDVTGKVTTPNTEVMVTDKNGDPILDENKNPYTGTSDEDGNVTITIPENAVTPGTEVTITPAGGNTSTGVTVPDKPVVTDPAVIGNHDGGYDVTGKVTTPNTEVTLTDENGTPIVGENNKPYTGMSDGEGNVTITIPEDSVAPGDEVTLTPAGGNTSTAVEVPTKPVVTEPSITGNHDGGYDVTGKTAPNTEVTLTDENGDPILDENNDPYTGTSDEEGNVTITIPEDAMTPGNEVTLTPAGGNPSTGVEVPTKPVVTEPSIAGNHDGGYDVTGKTTPNTEVTLTDKNGDPIVDENGDPYVGTSDEDGNVTITIPEDSVAPGDEVTLTPTGGNTSTSVEVPTKPVVTEPSIVGNHDGGYDVTGKTTPNTEVTVTDENGDPIVDENNKPYTGTSDREGNVTITIPEDSVLPGDEVTLTPAGGNTSTVVEVPTKPVVTGPAIEGNHEGGYDVTGMTTPNTEVTLTDKNGDPIFDSNGDPYTGTSDEDGKVTITVPEDGVTPGTEVTLTPNGGNTSTGVEVPTKPVVTEPSITGNHDGGYDVTGKTTANTDVTLTDENGDPILDENNDPYTGTSDEDGNVTITVPEYSVTPGNKVTLTPAGGNTSTGVEVPTKPVVTEPAITGNHDGGYDITGQTTPNTAVTLTDENGDPIVDENGDPYIGTSDEDGNVTITIPEGTVTPGNEVTLTPAGGNTSTGVEVPTKPVVTKPAITGNHDGGYDVTGKTTPNTTVTLTDENGDPIVDGNGDPYTGTSDEDGNVTITIPEDAVTPGDQITLTPAGGNTSTEVTVPTKPVVTEPSIIGNHDGGYDVTGKTTPNTEVTLTDENGDPIVDDNGDPYTGTSDEDGNVTITIPEDSVTPGDQITLTPAGGNTSTDVTVPTKPVVTEPAIVGNHDGGYDVTGKTTPNTEVTITDENGDPIVDENGDPYTGTSNEDGNVTITIPEDSVTPGDQITLTPAGGNTSTEVTVPTKPVVTEPTINGNHDGGYDVTGKTTPNTVVTLTDENGDPIVDENGDPYIGTSDEYGNVTITIPEGAVTPGNEVTLTPAGGNTSTGVEIPTKPVVTEPAITGNHDGGYDVTGKTTPNTAVTLTDENDDPIVDENGDPYTGTSDEDGNITITIPEDSVTPGDRITLTPAGGNTSTEVTVPTKTVVTEPAIVGNHDGGYDVTGKTTPNTEVTLTDENGDPILDENGDPYTGTSDEDGNITITIPEGAVTPGNEVTLTPVGGNTSTGVEVPTKPVVTEPSITGNHDGGYDVTGKTAPNTEITITDENGDPILDENGDPYTGTSDEDGNVTITIPEGSVVPGTEITLTPAGGNTSTGVEVPTKPVVTEPSITGNHDGGYDVTGKTTPNTEVTITDENGDPILDENGDPYTGTSDDDGNITITIPEGSITPETEITLTPAGGNTSAGVEVPTKPVINEPTITANPDGGYDITGETTPNTTVTVTDGEGNPVTDENGTPLTGTSDENGQLTITIPGGVLLPGDVITLTPAGGNPSTTMTVPDLMMDNNGTPIAKPTDSSQETSTPQSTGTSTTTTNASTSQKAGSATATTNATQTSVSANNSTTHSVKSNQLPQTGNDDQTTMRTAGVMGLLAALASTIGLAGIGKRRKREDDR